MKYLLFISMLQLAGNLIAQTTPPLGIISKTPELKALTNARIVTAPGNLIDSAILVIDRGKVVAVGDDIAIPDGARIIDLGGKTVYPGFVEPFTEYGLKAVPTPERRQRGRPVYEGTRIGCNAWNDAIHAQENWVESFKPDGKEAEELLKQGFTTVQSAHLDGIWRGRSFVTSLGEGLPNDLVLRPYSLHFASFDKGHSRQEYPSSLMGGIALLRQTLLDVDWYKKAHAAHSGNPAQKLPEFNTAIEALAEISTENILFYSDNELSLLRADQFGREFSQGMILVGSGSEYSRIEGIKATGRTLIVPVNYPEQPEVTTLEDELDVTLAELRHWERAPYNPAVLEEHGLRFAFTTHGLEKKDKFLNNVRLAVKRGLSKETALAALTTIPAEICGVADRVGTIESGKMADFFVCNGDVFDDSAKIHSTWTHGVEKEFLPLKPTDFSGKYALTLGEKQFDLILTGKDTPEGKLKVDTNSVKLDKVTTDRNKLSFTAALDTFDLPGVARFTGRKIEEEISGRVFLGDGGQAVWTAFRTGEPDEPKENATEEAESSEDNAGDTENADEPEAMDEGKPEAAEEDTLVSHLTLPNGAYGLERIPTAENLHIRNATVWTSEDAGILDETDILVKDGKFERVGRNLQTPSGYRVIDATSKHVTAGIIDEHSHAAISGDVNEGTDAVTSEVRISDVVNPDDISLYRSLAGGVTMARLLHGSANPIGGQAEIIKYRWGSPPEDLKYRKAPPSIKFALGENVKQSNWGEDYRIRYPQTRMGVENIIKDAFQAAREYEADWKAYNALGRNERERTIPPRRDLRLEALVEVLNSERHITCHAYVQTEILMLMRLAEQFGFKVRTLTHILEGYKVADEMAKHGAGAGCFSDWWAYKFEVYDAIPYNPCLMHEKGVVVSVNSDSQDLQRRLNQEAAKSVMYCGMSQEDAWKMVTINPAWQLDVDQWVGSIKEGKEADFVIWNDNPLSIYAHPEQTWVDGTQYFDLQKDLAAHEQIRDERNALIQKILKGSDKGGKPEGKDKKHGKWRPGGDVHNVLGESESGEGRTQ